MTKKTVVAAITGLMIVLLGGEPAAAVGVLDIFPPRCC